MTDVTHDYDVLIVGGGNAACSTAHAALEKTKRVGIIEKSTKRDRGGNSAMTGHIRFVFNGIEDLRPLVRNMPDDELRKLPRLRTAPAHRGNVLGRDDAGDEQSKRRSRIS